MKGLLKMETILSVFVPIHREGHKFVGKYLLPIFLKKMVSNFEDKVKQQQGYQAPPEQTKEGETIIDKAPPQPKETNKKVGEYIDFDETIEEIEALRQEIAVLRTDLLAQQIKNIELETGQPLNINTDALKDQLAGLGSNLEANQASLADAQEKSAKATAEATRVKKEVDKSSGVGYF